eukprot:jgi/Botrbrau1/16401/Bobra.0142s0001.1
MFKQYLNHHICHHVKQTTMAFKLAVSVIALRPLLSQIVISPTSTKQALLVSPEHWSNTFKLGRRERDFFHI